MNNTYQEDIIMFFFNFSYNDKFKTFFNNPGFFYDNYELVLQNSSDYGADQNCMNIF